MTTINIRIEEKIKSQATKTLAKLGLDMSSAVKLFLHQVVNEQGLPFAPTKNPAAIRARWDEQVAEALRNGKSYTSAKELHAAISKLS